MAITKKECAATIGDDAVIGVVVEGEHPSKDELRNRIAELEEELQALQSQLSDLESATRAKGVWVDLRFAHPANMRAEPL